MVKKQVNELKAEDFTQETGQRKKMFFKKCERAIKRQRGLIKSFQYNVYEEFQKMRIK